MKCPSCGKEIPDGLMYCPSCGKEVQIVPEYDMLDEDIIPSMVKGKRKKSSHEGNMDRHGANVTPAIRIIILIALAGVFLLTFYLFYRSSPKTLLKEAEKNMKALAYEEAEENYRDLLDKDPSDPAYMTGLSKALVKEGRKDEALPLLLSAVEKDPDLFKAYDLLFPILYEKKAYGDMASLEDSYGGGEKKILKLFSSYPTGEVSFSEDPGRYDEDLSLALSTDEGGQIIYTVDGSEPGPMNGETFTDPIPIGDGETLVSARVLSDEGHLGPVTEGKYKVTYQVPSDPLVTPESGTYSGDIMIQVTSDPGTRVYYSFDEEDPTASSTPYTGPIPMREGNHVVSFISVSKQGLFSSVVRRNYIYEAGS